MISINYTNNPRRVRKLFGIAGAIFTLAIPYFIMLQNSNEHIETAQSLCPFKLLTGFPCPGCGITKSFIFFYEGDFLKSFYYHLFGPFVILFCLATILILTTELITKKEYFNAVLYNKKLAYGLGFALATYHLSRLIYFVMTNHLDDILHQSIWK